MIRMETVSLSIGIAALFTTCVQRFEHFEAVSALTSTLDRLLVMLEFEQQRLLVWAESLGIGDIEWI